MSQPIKIILVTSILPPDTPYGCCGKNCNSVDTHLSGRVIIGLYEDGTWSGIVFCDESVIKDDPDYWYDWSDIDEFVVFDEID